MIPFGRPVHVASAILALCCVRTVLAADLPQYRQESIAGKLDAPTGVAVDERGHVYVTESSRNRLLVFNRNGEFVEELKGLDKPTGVAAGGDRRVYVCNTGKRAIEVYRRNLSLMFRIGPEEGALIYPTAIALDQSGNLFVVDSGDHRVKVYDRYGHLAYSFGGKGNGDGKFNFPVSIAINDAAGEIIVSDLQETQESIRGARVQVLSMNGVFLRRFGQFGQGEGLFVKPMGVAVDGDGRIYVADAFQNAVQVFDSGGSFLQAIHDPVHPVRTPLGIAYHRKANRLFVVSLNTSRVEIFGASAAKAGGP